MSDFDFDRFDALTFDCYGTLIDWERGILNALQPVLAPRGVDVGEEELLELYARHEAELEAGTYLPYRDVVAGSLRRLAADLDHDVSDEEAAAFAAAVGDWPAFPDTASSLRHLQDRFRLGVITNCDRDLFARSNLRLGVTLEPTSRASPRSSSPSRRSMYRASASSMWLRASFTTTCRPRSSGSRPSGSTAATTGRDSAPRPKPWPSRT
jgi:2-haloacid dehalogenase